MATLPPLDLNKYKVPAKAAPPPLDLSKFKIAPPAPAPSKGFAGTVADAAKSVAGGLKALEQPFVSSAAIPVQVLAKATGQPDPYTKGIGGGAPPADVTPIDQPLKKLGEVGEVASYAIPYGRFAKLGTLSHFAASTAAGYGTDVASKLASGKKGTDALTPGLGTVLGAAIPGAPLLAKGAARLVGESIGVTTGAGYGSIKQAFQSAKTGGKTAQEYVSALRGNTSPDSIVKEAQDSLGKIITDRRVSYQKQLETIAGDKTVLNIQPIVKTISDQLQRFKIATKDGVLNFSSSAIRFDKEAQKDVQTIFDEMKTFGVNPKDRTAVGVDSLKQALGDLYSKSSNVRALVTAVKGSTRDVLSKVPGYDKLTKDYATKTDLINEIQKGLSLGDKAQVDTGFKKLVSALRLNNDFRKEMIQELDKASGGALSSRIAGQQMSEILPRGIMRPLEGFGALTAAASGFLLPLLKFAAFASPRVVGEIVNALGISSAAATKVFKILGGQQTITKLKGAISPSVQLLKPQAPQGGGETPPAGQ